MAKILIIDDDVSIGNMIETALLKAGHEAWRAYSGTEALFCWRGNGRISSFWICAAGAFRGRKVVDVIRYFAASANITSPYKVKLMKLMWYADALAYKKRGALLLVWCIRHCQWGQYL